MFVLLTLSRLWSAMVNRTPHWRNILAWGYLKESVFFNDRPVHQLYLVKKQYGLFRLWLITICNETHLSLVAAHLYLFFNILLIHTFLITPECETHGGGGEREGIGISTYLGSRGKAWEKLKLKYFLQNAEIMEEVTSEGYWFSTWE